MWPFSGSFGFSFVNADVNDGASQSVNRTAASGYVYSGVRFNPDGTVEANNASGTASFSSAVALADWLSGGVSNGVWCEWAQVSITAVDEQWYDDWGGEGNRILMESVRYYGQKWDIPSTGGSITLDFKFYDAQTGGNLLGTYRIVFNYTRL